MSATHSPSPERISHSVVMLQIDLKHIAYFLDTSERKSMVKAAKVHGVTQPAITHAMQTLEKTLGEPLFRRTEGGLKLTHFGRQFRDEAEAYFSMLEQGMARVKAVHREEAGKIVLANSVDCIGTALGSCIADLGVEVLMHDEGATRAMAQLKMGAVDLAIVSRYPDPDDYESLESELVTSSTLSVYLPRHHELSRQAGGRISIEDLSKVPLVTLDQKTFPGHIDDLEQNFMRKQVPLRIAQLASNERTLINYARAGIGAAVVVGSFTRHGHGDLERLKVTGMSINVPRRIEVLWRRQGAHATLTRFRERLVAHLRETV